MARPNKTFSKQEIKIAIEKSKSFFGAARYLNVSYNTFKKYAELHGLWIEGGKNPSAKGISKPRKGVTRDINAVLRGERNGKRLNLTKLREWIVREGIFQEKCANCGLEEKRVTDYKVPLVLNFEDGDRTNYKKENLKLLCYNCTFYLVGDFVGRGGRNKTYYTDISGDIYRQIKIDPRDIKF